MKRFTHITVTSVEQAIPLLDERTRALAGGTDLVAELQEGLVAPERLVSLRGLPGLRGVNPAEDGGLRLGALTTLADIERHAALREGPYTALAQAAHLAASLQLRNVATIGGNLLQNVRCWYYRGPFTCWLKGGEECYARSGEHHLHALVEQSICIAPHPSDPATALLALDAQVVLAGPDGERTVGLLELLAPPSAERRRLHTLGQSELLLGLTLPARAGWRSVYLKAMERSLFAFALVGAAVAIRVEGGVVAEARIALGGVANTPILAEDAAASLVGQPLTEATIHAAAGRVLVGATPLPQTVYKEELAVRLVGAALSELA